MIVEDRNKNFWHKPNDVSIWIKLLHRSSCSDGGDTNSNIVLCFKKWLIYLVTCWVLRQKLQGGSLVPDCGTSCIEVYGRNTPSPIIHTSFDSWWWNVSRKWKNKLQRLSRPLVSTPCISHRLQCSPAPRRDSRPFFRFLYLKVDHIFTLALKILLLFTKNWTVSVARFKTKKQRSGFIHLVSGSLFKVLALQSHFLFPLNIHYFLSTSP